jgi:hypothetical protein
MAAAGDYLDQILALRDLFLSTPCLMTAFSHAMNLLGCEGNFGKDYQRDISDDHKARVTAAMKAMGEI